MESTLVIVEHKKEPLFRFSTPHGSEQIFYIPFSTSWIFKSKKDFTRYVRVLRIGKDGVKRHYWVLKDKLGIGKYFSLNQERRIAARNTKPVRINPIIVKDINDAKRKAIQFYNLWRNEWGEEGRPCPALRGAYVKITNEGIDHLFFIREGIPRSWPDVKRRIMILPAAKKILEKTGTYFLAEGSKKREGQRKRVSYLVVGRAIVSEKEVLVGVVLKKRTDGQKVYFSVQDFGEL